MHTQNFRILLNNVNNFFLNTFHLSIWIFYIFAWLFKIKLKPNGFGFNWLQPPEHVCDKVCLGRPLIDAIFVAKLPRPWIK